MRGDPADVRAMKQLLLTGLLAFLLGFALCLALLGYILVRHLWPRDGWWSLIQGLQFVVWAVLGGLAFAALLTQLLSRHHYRMGYHRCHQCNRPLRGIGIPCVCLPKQLRPAPPPRPRLRHHRRQVVPVLLAYLCLLPPALLLATISGGNPHYSFPTCVAILHVMLCILPVAIHRLIDDMLRKVNRRTRRFTLRMDVFIPVFCVWPLALIAAMIVLVL